MFTSEDNSDAQFYKLADLMPILCWVANADGWIFWYNRRWYEYTNTTPEQMEGWGWQSVHDPVTLPEVLDRWKDSIASGKPFEMTFPLKGADGQFEPFLTRITPMLGPDEKIQRWIGVNINIREERQALELREQFMAILGHDLRNPLGAISSGLELLRKTPLDDRATALTGMMQLSATRMLSLIDDLTDFARNRLGGGLPLSRNADEPLEPVLRQVIAELAVHLPDRVIEAEFDLVEPVFCDRARLGQLMSNLLNNALTYGFADHPVRVRAISGPDGFTLSVANAGKPIAPHDMERLFLPFYRGAVRPSRQGLGLGLFIAHEIAAAHGGRLTAASTAEETCFTFEMPAAR